MASTFLTGPSAEVTPYNALWNFLVNGDYTDIKKLQAIPDQVKAAMSAKTAKP